MLSLSHVSQVSELHNFQVVSLNLGVMIFPRVLGTYMGMSWCVSYNATLEKENNELCFFCLFKKEEREFAGQYDIT